MEESILDKCDRIAPQLLSNSKIIQGKRTGNAIFIDLNEISLVIDHLADAGHLKRKDNQPNVDKIEYVFTDAGREFFTLGGYAAKAKRDRKQKNKDWIKMWVPIIISVLAFIISVLNYVNSKDNSTQQVVPQDTTHKISH